MEAPSSWRYLIGDNSSYMMKKIHDENGFRIIVSDMIQVWVKESSAEELLRIFQELNPLIECSDHSLVHKIWAMLDDGQCSNNDASSMSLDVAVIDNNTLDLKFKTVMDGLSIKFYLKLFKETPNVFFEQVTVPLLSAAEELLSRQESLCILLSRKDLEITQYKLEGACLSRKNVETEHFSKIEFLTKSHLQSSTSSPCEGVLKVLQGASFLPNVNIECKDVPMMDASKPICSNQQDDSSPIVNNVHNLNPTNLNINLDEVTGDTGTGQTIIKPPVRETQMKISRKKKIKLNL